MQETSGARRTGDDGRRGAAASSALLGAARRDRPRRDGSRRCAAHRAGALRPVRGIPHHGAPGPGRSRRRRATSNAGKASGSFVRRTRPSRRRRRRSAPIWTDFGRRNSRPSIEVVEHDIRTATVLDRRRARGHRPRCCTFCGCDASAGLSEPLMVTEAWLPTDLADTLTTSALRRTPALRIALRRRCRHRSDAARDHRGDRGSAQRAAAQHRRSVRRCFGLTVLRSWRVRRITTCRSCSRRTAVVC